MIFCCNCRSKWGILKDDASKYNINALKILEHNNNIIGYKKDNTIYLLQEDNKKTFIKLYNSFSEGNYSIMYNTNKHNTILSISKKTELINHQSLNESITNFINSCLIQKILYYSKIKYIPNIFNFFFYLKDNEINLCKEIEKLDFNAYEYLKKTDSFVEWLNFIVQVTHIINYFQKEYKFNHGDLKMNNIMGKPVMYQTLLYEGDNYSFHLYNCGIKWYLIDFGFSSLSFNNKEYASYEFFNKDCINYKIEKDISLLFFYLLYFYKKIPPLIKHLLENSIKTINFNNKVISLVPKKNYYDPDQIKYIYEKLNSKNLSNENCYPENILRNINFLLNKK